VLLEQCRHDVQALARLKHPCVLRLIAPLEESRTQLVFITEPLANSLADLLGGGGPAALPPALAQERRSLHLSELEIKHGLLQVADGLHFLHAEAGLVHRGICPAAVVITAAGGWRAALSPQQGWWGALPKRVWGTTFAFLFVGEQPWSEATCGCCRGRRAGALRRTLPGLLYALPCLTRRPQASQAPGSWPALASRPRWSTGRTVAAALTTQTPTRSCCRA
jgi:serine/threonine protein kinase